MWEFDYGDVTVQGLKRGRNVRTVSQKTEKLIAKFYKIEENGGGKGLLSVNVCIKEQVNSECFWFLVRHCRDCIWTKQR